MCDSVLARTVVAWKFDIIGRERAREQARARTCVSLPSHAFNAEVFQRVARTVLSPSYTRASGLESARGKRSTLTKFVLDTLQRRRSVC